MWRWRDAGVDGVAGWARLVQTVVTLAWLAGGTAAKAASSAKEAAASGDSYQENVLGGDINIVGKRVTCDEFEPSYYPAPIFTCKNMRIGGHRLRYWVGPGVEGNYHCGIRMDQWKARNDLGALCHYLMANQGIKRTLWAAVVSEASCDISPGARLLFVKKDRQPDSGQSQRRSAGPIDGASYAWEEFQEGRGYVVTFRCMMVPE